MIFQKVDENHICVSKEDTAPLRFKEIRAARTQDECISFQVFISLRHKGLVNTYATAVVYVFTSELFRYLILFHFLELQDIPEHCMKNRLSSQMKIIKYTSHSPLIFADGRAFEKLNALVQSEKIDVNTQFHTSEQERHLLRNWNGPGKDKRKDIMILHYQKARGFAIVKEELLTIDFREHKYGKEDVCISSNVKNSTDSKSSHRDCALIEESDISNNCCRTPSQSYEDTITQGQVDQEVDRDHTGMELSRRLIADSFPNLGVMTLSGVTKHFFHGTKGMLCDKGSDKKSEQICIQTDDIRPNPMNIFNIRHLTRQVSFWVFPLLSTHQRAEFKHVVCYESIRLWTFHFSGSPVHDGSSITELAAAGFYNSGVEGEVACFSCSRWYRNFLAGIPLQNAHEPRCRWRETNKPLIYGTEGIQSALLIEFTKVFENSAVWKGKSMSQNISSSSIASSIATSNVPDCGRSSASARDFHGGASLQSDAYEHMSSSHEEGSGEGSLTRQSQIVQEDSSDSSRLILTSATNKPYELNLGQASGFQRNGIGEDVRDSADGTEPRIKWDLSGASYPQFASREARKESFRHWDPDHIQKPKDLVDLGFFYSGYSDCARCFYCGLGLKYWRPNDDPAYQHARFRPQCVYNKLLKGQEFIDKVQKEISQGQTASRNAGREDTKSRFDRSSAVTQAKEEGWTQDYLEEAYKRLNRAGTDAGNPLFSRLLLVLQDIQNERQSSTVAVPDSDPDSAFLAHDGVEQGESLQPLDHHGKVRLAEMEHARLKDRMHCMFCKVARVGCVFLPCGHVVACQDCGDKATVCILCSKHIAALANIYMS